MNWKNLIIACSIFFILGIMIPSKAEAILPPIPKRFHKEGLVEAYETACYRGRWGVICIRPRPAKGPLVKVKWWNNRGQSGTAWLLYSGQGGGGKVGRIGKKHKPILARFKHGSGVLGEVVVYAAKTWHRIR